MTGSSLVCSSLRFRCAAILYLGITFLLLNPGGTSAQNDFAEEMFVKGKSQFLLPDFTDSYGVVFRDINKDNRPDLYVVRFRNLNRLFINEGRGRPFADFTIQSGLGGNLMPHGQQNLELGASSADFNNDGFPDMVIAGWGVSTRLFRQHRGMRFEDITDQAGLKPPIDGNGAFWSDVNLDGNIDLFITDEHHPNHLYLGDGAGHFREVSDEWGISGNQVSEGAAFCDVDGDGYPDLYVCNWFAPDIFYRNTGQNRFEPQQLDVPHLTDSLNSNGVTFGDIDNNGTPDLLVTDRNGRTALYRNRTAPGDTAWSFTNITDSAGISVSDPAYGSVIADFDNDGLQDIWINTIGPNIFYLNIDGRHFRKAFQEDHRFINFKKYYSTGAAAADIDLDGDLDLFVANKDTHSVLYVNPANNKEYLEMKLTGFRSNRDAIGARIWLFQPDSAGEKRVLCGYREISGGGGYLSENALLVHFGVDPRRRYEAKISFPGGRERLLTGLRAGKLYSVAEYEGIAAVFYRTIKLVDRTIGQNNFWLDLSLFLLLVALLVGYTLFSTSRYRWATGQIILFLAVMLILLYGIFLLLQGYSLRTRMVVQLGTLAGFMILLTFFMEKIRRLELRRYGYRRLLQDFSQQLIFIKDNRELYERLVTTIYRTVRPRFCVIYESEDSDLRQASGAGSYHSAPIIMLPQPLQQLQHTGGIDFSDHLKHLLEFPEDSHLFPISREDRYFGILAIGPAEGKLDYSTEDLAVFQSLATQTAIALENNLYIEESKKLTQRITEAETREKYVQELEEKNRTLRQLYRELQDTQTQLIQSEKMAGLGQLVAGIAHELNNPVSFVYANMKELQNYIAAIDRLLAVLTSESGGKNFQPKLAQTLREIREKYDLDFIQQDIQSLIEESIEGSQRLKNVVQNLRNFSRLDEAELKEVDLHEGLESTLLLLNNEIKDRITVHKDYGELPGVTCHPGQINQVFMNLLMNAVQAIEKNGNIWIKTGNLENQVEIIIRDDGKGIPEDIRQKIFDPFFTTKPVGKGTGLGLSISYNIIKEHGGNITVESEEGRGTAFRIVLPVQHPEKT